VGSGGERGIDRVMLGAQRGTREGERERGGEGRRGQVLSVLTLTPSTMSCIVLKTASQFRV
jgi:hypothetical protein